MTQFQHHLITWFLITLTMFLFGDHLTHPDEKEYWKEKVDRFFDKYFNF